MFNFCFSTISFSQSIDTLTQKVNSLEMKIQNLEDNFNNYNTQYKIGISLIAFGTLQNLISTNQDDNWKDTFIFMGSVETLVGIGLIVSSHFAIAKCRNLTIKPNGINIRL